MHFIEFDNEDEKLKCTFHIRLSLNLLKELKKLLILERLVE